MIKQISKFLKPYSSYDIYIDGLCKKSSQAYDDIFLADNGPVHPDRIKAGISIIIAPQSEDWRNKHDTQQLCIHIKNGSTKGA